ncbi:ABC transporter ATP-binding protein [Flavobacterium sp. MAH-1]|uniref:ABC transporter ATP-binding protein n=1 Tax=Flavobacterium agri TaxID=2743471 RepID=A0A7Y8Y226_9FLAO|nr:ABC transporter ATP-binding protein [Flavobacterium agri]NUY80951.1 ABC transporter ATP-binding protein [Flavobacterium agri]NYA70975.1 ABC transporter ATP-binding protein [Flavobacterium agri]
MLEVADISFSYDSQKTIDQVSFALEKGKQLALIGESGCGKSTLLKLLYGHHDLQEGEIVYNGNAILGPKFNLIPGDDRFKYLAQDFGLMPFTTVSENVGNYLSNIHKEKKQQRIAELLEMVEMTEFANVKAKFLSGGQQQRVALAKALAVEPELLLLDEPFSQIDAFRSATLKRNLFRYFRDKQISCIIATHDGSDVLSFADEVVIMKDGKIIESGRPKAIYANPGSAYIARMFGEVSEIPLRLLKPVVTDETVLVYAHQLKIAGSGLRASVKHSYFLGNHYLIEANYEGGTLFFENRVPILDGEGVFLSLSQ